MSLLPVLTNFLAALESANTLHIDGRPVVGREIAIDSARLFLSKDTLTAFVDVPQQPIVVRNGRASIKDQGGVERSMAFEVTVSRPLQEADLRMFQMFTTHTNS